MQDEDWPTVRISAARLEQLEAERDIAQKMLAYLEREMAEVESNIERGKGTWPNKDYVRDDTWLRWYATHRALFLMRDEWRRLLNENSAAKQPQGEEE